MKYNMLYVLLLMNVVGSTQGKPSIPDNGVYLSDSDFLHRQLKDGFAGEKGSRLNDNRKNYLLVKTANIRDTFYFDNIWGYRKDGGDWRVYNGEYYKVDFINEKICLYDVPGTGQSEGIRTRYYFSVSPGSPVHHLAKRELLAAYSGNRAFCEKIKDLSWARSILKWDKERQNYVFVGWL